MVRYDYYLGGGGLEQSEGRKLEKLEILLYSFETLSNCIKLWVQKKSRGR